MIKQSGETISRIAMPQNRVVHQLLRGRKRKAKSIGASTRAVSSRDDLEKHESGTGDNQSKVVSSTFQSLLSPKTSVSNKDRKQTQTRYESRVSQRQLVGRPSNYRMELRTIHAPASGVEASVTTKKSTIDTNTLEGNPESSTNSASTCTDRNVTQQKRLEEQSQRRKSRYQHRIQSGYRRRCNKKRREKRKNSSENGNLLGSHHDRVDANGTFRDNDDLDQKESIRIENLTSSRQRIKQPSRNINWSSEPVPFGMKDNNDAFAEKLVGSFLEQRSGKSFSPPNTLSSLSPLSSFLHDTVLLPVFLLGISALSQLVDCYEQKQKEAELARSPLVRELVLWMKDRQEIHAAHTSESIVRKHVDALNQLAKFQASIDTSHQISLQLRPLQRANEMAVENRRPSQKHNNFHVGHTKETKSVAHRFGLNTTGSKCQTGLSDNFLFEKQKVRRPRKDDQEKQHQDHLQGGHFAKEINLQSNTNSIISKHGDDSYRAGETAVMKKAPKKIGDPSNIDINQDSVWDRKLPSTIQLKPAHDTSSSQVPMFANHVDCRTERNPVIDDVSRVLTSPSSSLRGKMEQSMPKPILPETNVDLEEEKDEEQVPDTEREEQQLVQCGVEEIKNGDCVEHEGDHWDGNDSDAISDDMSEVLLSQSIKHLPRSRRVTASPRTFSDDNAQKRTERYKHFSEIDFTGENQVERRKKRSTSYRQSLDKGWVSKVTKGSPTFKQTSMTPYVGWVSNQGARNVIKNERSPRMITLAQTIPISGGPSSEEDIKGETGAFGIQNDGGDRTPIGRRTVSPKNGFVSSTIEVRNHKRLVEDKMTSFACRNKSSLLEQQNDAPRCAKQRRGFRQLDEFARDGVNGINQSNISFGRGKSDNSNESAKDHAYEEVVRGKAAREALIGYECKECAAFFDEAVLHGDGAKYFDRDELLRCSRHRARQTPPQTPQDFWELSFRDEKLARTKRAETKPN